METESPDQSNPEAIFEFRAELQGNPKAETVIVQKWITTGTAGGFSESEAEKEEIRGNGWIERVYLAKKGAISFQNSSHRSRKARWKQTTHTGTIFSPPGFLKVVDDRFENRIFSGFRSGNATGDALKDEPLDRGFASEDCPPDLSAAGCRANVFLREITGSKPAAG